MHKEPLTHSKMDRREATAQIAAGLLEIEASLRHIRHQVKADADPTYEILRETAAVQATLSQLERVLLLCQLDRSLDDVRNGKSDGAPEQLNTLLEIFTAFGTLKQIRS